VRCSREVEGVIGIGRSGVVFKPSLLHLIPLGFGGGGVV